jgi:hypothetical protein
MPEDRRMDGKAAASTQLGAGGTGETQRDFVNGTLGATVPLCTDRGQGFDSAERAQLPRAYAPAHEH